MATVTMETEGKGLERNLAICNIQARYTNGTIAPQLFRFDFEMVKPAKVTAIKNAVQLLRNYYGDYEYAETPNGKGFSIIRPLDKPSPVYLANLQEQTKTAIAKDPNGKQKCYLCFGQDTFGNNIIRNIDDCKSMLVAGTAGSGKSVVLNDFIIQILLYSNADLILIDPKDGAEFGIYENDVHNRILQIAKNTPDAIKALKYAFDVMQKRYTEMGQGYQKKYGGNRLIIVIDELAELMEENHEEVEEKVRRIAAKGRAAGVHLIVATQDPRAQVVTGLIKYNLQTKICLKTANARHSMNVMDKGDGAKLLGRGDAYIKFEDTPEFIRVQTPYVSDEQIWKLITKRTA